MSGRSGQSPPPEDQDGKQGSDIPGTGNSVNKDTNNQSESKDQLEGLSSNPTHPLQQASQDKTNKTEK